MSGRDYIDVGGWPLLAVAGGVRGSEGLRFSLTNAVPLLLGWPSCCQGRGQ